MREAWRGGGRWAVLLAGAVMSGCGGGGGRSDPPAEVVRSGPCGSYVGYQVRAASNTIRDDTTALVLDWRPPVLRQDGAPLPPEEIGGYLIYVGDRVGDLSEVISVAPDQVSYRLPAEHGRRYVLVISAFDRLGNEGLCAEPQLVEMP